MKTVIRRHVRAYHVFRALRVAQAIREVSPLDEVFIECLQEFQHVLGLVPAVKWKNPHQPFEVAERPDLDPNNHRKGGNLYDHVIDIDSEGPFDAPWMAYGGSFWDWVVERAGRHPLPIRDSLVRNPWPKIETAIPAGARPDLPAEFVLLAPISQESDPAGLNLNSLSAWADKAFPGVPQRWATFGQNFGPDRPRAAFSNLIELAGVISAAKAVVTVKGIVAGIAQSTYQIARLAKILVLVTDPAKAEGQSKPERRRSALSLPGPLLDLGEAAQAVRANPDKTAVLEPQISGALKELTPHPAD